MFFHIASEPRLQKELQAELDALPAQSHDHLVGIKLLDAIINETLRLHPAVPSGTQRTTPPEGISIGDRYIPGDVIVCIPTHTMFRG
jgi:cytochrome P450